MEFKNTYQKKFIDLLKFFNFKKVLRFIIFYNIFFGIIYFSFGIKN